MGLLVYGHQGKQEGTSWVAGRVSSRGYRYAKLCHELNFLVPPFALQKRGNARTAADRTDCKSVLAKGTPWYLALQFRKYIFMYLGYLFFNLSVIAKHEISVKLNFPYVE